MVDILLFFHIFKKLQQTWLPVMLFIMQPTEYRKLKSALCKTKTCFEELRIADMLYHSAVASFMGEEDDSTSFYSIYYTLLSGKAQFIWETIG